MKRLTKRFALCLENAGNEASLILGKVYRVVPDVRAAKDGLVRIIDESGEDYLFEREQFAFVELPHAVRKKILALDRLFNAVLCLDLVRNLAEIFYYAEVVFEFPELGRGDEVGIKTDFIVLSP